MGYRKTTKENTKHISTDDFYRRIRFRLKKNTDTLKKGKLFDPMMGFVHGTKLIINGEEKTVEFKDREYFDGVINFTKSEIDKFNGKVTDEEKFVDELSKLTKKYGVKVESVGELYLTNDDGEVGSLGFDYNNMEYKLHQDQD